MDFLKYDKGIQNKVVDILSRPLIYVDPMLSMMCKYDYRTLVACKQGPMSSILVLKALNFSFESFSKAYM